MNHRNCQTITHTEVNNKNTIILGIGQSMRGDDAAGLEAVRVWQQNHPLSAKKVVVELCEMPGLALLDRLDGVQAAVLVDTLRAPSAPGTLYRLGPDDLSAFEVDAHSAHGWGLAETLALGRILKPELAKCRITLIGIVGEQFNLGKGLSAAVQGALFEAVALIEKEVQTLLAE
jgi:hydrogenase maturation protease